MTDLLSVEAVRKTYALNSGISARLGLTPRKEFRALDGVSLSVAPREVLGLVGESGSGKTTLARTLVRLVSPEQGSIRFEGEDVLAASGESCGPYVAACRWSIRTRIRH